MPDPGEPHLPDPTHFPDPGDYAQAVDEYVDLILPPEVLQQRQDAQRGVTAIEQFLEDHSDR